MSPRFRPPLIIDTHCDIAQAMVDRGVDIGRRQRTTHFDLLRAREGGLDAQVFALFVEPHEHRGPAAWRRTRTLLEAVERAAEAHERRMVLARTASDVLMARSEGRLAVLLGLEGGHGFGTEEPELVLSRLRLLAKRGLRYLGLTWNNSNALAGAAVDGGGGLTPLGRKVVRECERLGVLVDVSHASDATVRDVLAHARLPILASHSNARALCAVPRNLPDELIRAIGEKGGVGCANFFPGFLSERTATEIERLQGRLAEPMAELHRRFPTDVAGRQNAERRLVLRCARSLAKVTLADVVKHVEHLVRVAGEEAVGIGADFDGMLLTPEGLEDVTAYPKLSRALTRRLGSRVPPGVLGENVLGLLATLG